MIGVHDDGWVFESLFGIGFGSVLQVFVMIVGNTPAAVMLQSTAKDCVRQKRIAGQWKTPDCDR